jgi:hypothetical protein
MLAKFLECDEDEIKNYLKEADEITRIMLKMIKIKNNFDTIQSTMLSPLRGPVLYVCIRALKPQIMVETGVSSGSSTHYILKAMELNGQGKLYSIDLPNIGLSVLPKGEKNRLVSTRTIEEQMDINPWAKPRKVAAITIPTKNYRCFFT